MGRIGDDAHQPGGIQYAFFLIEIPAAVLLGHQAALQAVRQLGHRRLQRDQLLIEIGAQTGQFLVVAQFGSPHHFVMLGGIGLVLEIRRQIGKRHVGPPRHHAVLTLFAHFCVRHLIGVHLDFALLGALGRVRRILGTGFGGLVLAAAVVLFLIFAVFAGLFFLVLPVAFLGLVAGLVGIGAQAQIGEHVADQLRECRLILHVSGERIQMRAGLRLDMAAHHVHRLLCGARHVGTGQPFAHHKADGAGQRHFLGSAGAHDRIGAHAHFGHAVEVARHPGHFGRAQGFKARLFQRIPDVPRQP